MTAENPPLDDLDFNDPSGWGFCDRCAFEVAVHSGLLVEHRYHRIGSDDARCTGSGKKPFGPTPLIAEAGAIVSFHKDAQRGRTRSWWQRERWKRRSEERARGGDST